MSAPEYGPAVRIMRGNPQPEELAAVSAVMAAVLEEHAAQRPEAIEPVGTAWSRSQRMLRGPVGPGATRWRSFGG